jgi:hypothetical protein
MSSIEVITQPACRQTAIKVLNELAWMAKGVGAGGRVVAHLHGPEDDVRELVTLVLEREPQAWHAYEHDSVASAGGWCECHLILPDGRAAEWVVHGVPKPEAWAPVQVGALSRAVHERAGLALAAIGMEALKATADELVERRAAARKAS